jgi:hypothetical protein
MALTFPGLGQILSGLNNAPGISKRQTREAEAQRALQELGHRQGVHKDAHQLDRDRFEWEKRQRDQQNNNPALRMLQQQQAEAARLGNMRAQMENKVLGQQTMRQLGPGMSANQGRQLGPGMSPNQGGGMSWAQQRDQQMHEAAMNKLAREQGGLQLKGAQRTHQQQLADHDRRRRMMAPRLHLSGEGGMKHKSSGINRYDAMRAEHDARMAKQQLTQTKMQTDQMGLQTDQMGLQTQQMRRAMQPQRPMGGRPAAARSSGGGTQPSARPVERASAAAGSGGFGGLGAVGGGGRPGFPGGPVRQGPIGSRTVGGGLAPAQPRNSLGNIMADARGGGHLPEGGPPQARSLSEEEEQKQLQRNRPARTGPAPRLGGRGGRGGGGGAGRQ